MNRADLIIASAFIPGIASLIFFLVWRLRQGRDWLPLLGVFFAVSCAQIGLLATLPNLTGGDIVVAGYLRVFLVAQAALPSFLTTGIRRLAGGRQSFATACAGTLVLTAVYWFIAGTIKGTAALSAGQAVATLSYLIVGVWLCRGPTLFYLLAGAAFVIRAATAGGIAYFAMIRPDPVMANILSAINLTTNSLAGFFLLLIEYDDTKRLLAEANRTQAAFFANISHELRTPLNAIIGYSETLDRQLLGPVPLGRYEAFGRSIFSAGQHMLQIVNQLLDMAAIEAGRMTLDIRPSPVLRVMDSAIDMLSHKAAQKNVVLARNFPATDIEVPVDENAFRQVALNLIGNAVKFSPSGGVVQIAVKVETNDNLAITVADQGPGIAPEHLPNIFTPFWQVEEIYGRTHDGVGLGLAIAQRLTGAMGGTIGVKSAPGAGSVFKVNLPVRA